ncbi:branched-chain amino acid ABC transporter permease [Methanothermococcus sp. SCGC AD-155-E23]|nr:branched-chain amino acid ABC transporter permease [Methanothermococcus sp. SCGC AD-155-E23]
MVELITLILFFFALYTIVSLSLNLEFGYGGIPNFGKALSVLTGALVVGGILNRLLIWYFGIEGDFISASSLAAYKMTEIISQNPLIGLGIFLFCVTMAVVAGAIAGALSILPSAKLKGDYLGVTLLAISEVVYLILFYNTEIVGGYYGVSVPDILAFVPGEYRVYAYTVLALISALLVYLFLERLLNSPYGRILRGHRENEDLIKAFGRDVMKLRVKTMALGSAIAAIAGVIFVFYSSSVVVNAFNRVEWTFYPFLIVLLGGKGNNKGVVLGAFIFVLLKMLIDFYKFDIKYLLHLPFEAVWLQYIVFGILALLILCYKPEGILKEEPIYTPPIKSRLKTNP